MKLDPTKLAGVNKYVSPITGFLGLAATAFDNKKLGKIANIAGQLGSVSESVAGSATKLPKMRKGGKMKGKKC
jgi:hypothetical protein